MGKSEEGRPSKSDKSSSPGPMDQNSNPHVYPDWAAMQAYYGPRVALPQYYNSAMASGHPPPPYMWPPQPIMPPYGSPYAAVYSPGGVYPHGAVPIGPQPHGLGAPTIPMAVSMSVEIPKSTEHKDRDLINNLKGRDGLADNSNGATTDGEERRLSQSVETEGSSDGSEGETTRRKKRSRDGTPPTGGGDGKDNSVAATEANGSSDKIMGSAAASASITGELVGHNITMTSLELGYPLGGAPKTSSTSVQQSGAVLPETWSEREIKRERRKQSNRESARRSRLRKQAEIEELGLKVDSLTAENSSLKSEISQMSEKSRKLSLENAALMEKLKSARGSSINTEDLLARVDNSNGEDEANLYESNSNSVAKLHQLLDTSPKADAVATS